MTQTTTTFDDQVLSRFVAQTGAALLAPVGQAGSRCCSWPIGAPGTETFGFCGSRVEGRGSYCVDHRAQGTVKLSAQANEKFFKAALWAADRGAWGGRAG